METRNPIIHSNVEFIGDYQLGDWVIVGERPAGREGESSKTVIGAGALVRSHSVIYAGNTIGEGFQTGHNVLIREGNMIGDHVSIGSHSIVEHHSHIGDGVRLHSNVFIPEYSVISRNVWIGPNAVLTNARYPQSSGVKERLKGPEILDGAIVGANATLLPGIIIGRNALVGAGSVVTKDVPDRAIVVGNPARVIGQIDNIREYANR